MRVLAARGRTFDCPCNRVHCTRSGPRPSSSGAYPVCHPLPCPLPYSLRYRHRQRPPWPPFLRFGSLPWACRSDPAFATWLLASRRPCHRAHRALLRPGRRAACLDSTANPFLSPALDSKVPRPSRLLAPLRLPPMIVQPLLLPGPGLLAECWRTCRGEVVSKESRRLTWKRPEMRRVSR